MKEYAPLTCRRCWYTTVSGYCYEYEVRGLLKECGWQVEKRLRNSVCPRCLLEDAFNQGRVEMIDNKHMIVTGAPFKFAYIDGEGDLVQRLKSGRELWKFLGEDEAVEFSKIFKSE